MVSPTTSSAWIQGIVDMLDGVGLDTSAILAEAGIDRAILANPDNRAPSEMVSRLWRVAAEHSGNPAIGLVSPHVPKPGNFDIVGYAMLSSSEPAGRNSEFCATFAVGQRRRFNPSRFQGRVMSGCNLNCLADGSPFRGIGSSSIS